MKEKIRQLASQLLQEVIGYRRHLHANPELSFQEFNTSAYIEAFLIRNNISYRKGIAGTGLTAFIEGKNPESKLIALRADMDALPIVEENNVEYKSKNNGVMHACGHDVHTSSLLGAALILNSLRTHWEGTVQLLFQPGEEVLPGGASVMLKEGVFEHKMPEAIFGQHVYPELPAGTIGLKPGPYMASTDEIYVTVKGRGGHGAKPDRNIDPVLITAHLITALQQVVSRWANPATPTVLSFGKVIANGATNIIPNEVKMEGTFRTFNEEWRVEAHQRMKDLATNLVKSMGGEVEFRIEVGYPVLKNDSSLTTAAKQFAIDYLGEEHVVDLDIRMTAEDFAYFSQYMPACFYRLGTASPKDDSKSYGVHNSKFDIDESALETGMGLMAWLTICQLSSKESV
ncbi:MAG: amidohydrolase [Flavobacteriales bacterium]|nr:amidohydrolase [Flavobacteriales bacterium]